MPYGTVNQSVQTAPGVGDAAAGWPVRPARSAGTGGLVTPPEYTVIMQNYEIKRDPSMGRPTGPQRRTVGKSGRHVR